MAQMWYKHVIEHFKHFRQACVIV